MAGHPDTSIPREARGNEPKKPKAKPAKAPTTGSGKSRLMCHLPLLVRDSTTTIQVSTERANNVGNVLLNSAGGTDRLPRSPQQVGSISTSPPQQRASPPLRTG